MVLYLGPTKINVLKVMAMSSATFALVNTSCAHVWQNIIMFRCFNTDGLVLGHKVLRGELLYTAMCVVAGSCPVLVIL